MAKLNDASNSAPRTQARADLLLHYLPAIYKAEPELARFLRPFEALLLGGHARLPEDPPGLREMIFALPSYIDPETTPEEFLPWLGSWVALTLRPDLAPARKRLLIARAASLFQWRGTVRGMRELLQIVAGEWVNPAHDTKPEAHTEPAITEPQLQSLIVGRQATVGESTRLGRELPYLFQVTFRLPHANLTQSELQALESLVRDTINLGKPAHTYYELKFTDSTGKPVLSALEKRTVHHAATASQ